ncbi:MAG: RNA polymerase sigma factor, partial [Candidatus Dormibacteria bacterium]
MSDSLQVALDGQREAVFETLARTMWPRLVAVAAAILDGRSDAEDVAQESLELAWRKWTALREFDKREQWVLRICVRQAISWRRRRLLRAAIRRPGAGDEPEDPRAAPEDDGIARGFAKCTPRQRAVLVLHFFDGYTLD